MRITLHRPSEHNERAKVRPTNQMNKLKCDDYDFKQWLLLRYSSVRYEQFSGEIERERERKGKENVEPTTEQNKTDI